MLKDVGIDEKYFKNVHYPYFAVFDIESSLEPVSEHVMESFGGLGIVSSWNTYLWL